MLDLAERLLMAVALAMIRRQQVCMGAHDSFFMNRSRFIRVGQISVGFEFVRPRLQVSLCILLSVLAGLPWGILFWSLRFLTH